MFHHLNKTKICISELFYVIILSIEINDFQVYKSYDDGCV
jgi:hypothetical protein